MQRKSIVGLAFLIVASALMSAGCGEGENAAVGGGPGLTAGESGPQSDSSPQAPSQEKDREAAPGTASQSPPATSDADSAIAQGGDSTASVSSGRSDSQPQDSTSASEAATARQSEQAPKGGAPSGGSPPAGDTQAPASSSDAALAGRGVSPGITPDRGGLRPPPAEPAPPARPAFQFANRKSKQQDLTFDDIKFEMEKTEPFERSMLTEKIEALEGKTVRIRGYMLPSFQQTGITRFVLVRDNMECCFGPGAALYDCIIVEMAEGKSADFSVRPIAVQGVFRIRPFLGPDGKHLAIYHLEGESVGS